MKTKLCILALLMCLGSAQGQIDSTWRDSTAAQILNEIEDLLSNRSNIATATRINRSYMNTYIGSTFVKIRNRFESDHYNLSDYDSLAQAITDIGSDSSFLIINKIDTVKSQVTIPATLALIGQPGGELYLNAAADTFFVNGFFDAGLYRIFSGPGVVQFADGSVPVVEVEWFGSGQAGVNKAIQSLTASGNVRFSKAITITDSILIDKNYTHFYGSNFSGNEAGIFSSTPIIVSSGTSDAIVVTGANCLLENFTIDGGASTVGDDGLRLEALTVVRNVAVIRMGGNGIRMGQDSNNMNGWILQNIFTFKNDSSGVYIHDAGPGSDANAGVAFYLFSKDNGLDGLRIENAFDNQFYMLRCDGNTGYGIKLMSGAKANFIPFPYLEANTIGTGIMDSGANQNFIFGTRQGTSDGWTDNGTDNVIMGRENSLNDMYMFKGNVAFDSLFIADQPFLNSGLWQFYKEAATRNLIIQKHTTANANVIIKSQVSGTTDLVIEDGGIAIQGGSLIVNGTYNFAADAQADDDYEVSIPNITALTAGLEVTFTATTANTGGATLEITAVGDLDAILKMHDQALATNDIEAGQVVTVVFDGTNWQMTSQIAQ